MLQRDLDPYSESYCGPQWSVHSSGLHDARRRLTQAFPKVNDHPDVAGILRDGESLALVGSALADPFRGEGVTIVLAPEARGPILGALVARELQVGLVLARKADRNHPGADIPVMSAPTWRGQSETFQGRSFDLHTHDRVLIVDDWITTGSTIRAAMNMLRVTGSTYVGSAVLMNKAVSAVIDELRVHWLVAFDDVMS